MNNIVKRVGDLNAELMPPYYQISTSDEVVVKRQQPQIVISKESPTLDISYFDLVAVNILLANHNKVIYSPPAEIAELACNLFYIANLRCEIYTSTQAERVYESLAFNTIPPNMLVYQFLNKIIQNKSTKADIWLQYMLLLWGFLSPRYTPTHPYKSRAIVGYVNRCMLTTNRNEHEHDLTCDNLRMLETLKGYILLCTNDRRYQNTAYILYMVDALQMFVVTYLAALIRRSCTWPDLCELGNSVLHQKLNFHEHIVRLHYELHKQTGAVNESAGRIVTN